MIVLEESNDDCDNILLCVGKDNERTLPPTNVLMENNLFNSKTDKIFTAYDDISGFRFVSNYVTTKSGKFKMNGFAEKKLSDFSSKDTGLAVPSKTSKIYPKNSCGASWYKSPTKIQKKLSGKTITVSSLQNSLTKAIESASAGDVIELTSEGEYLIDNSIEINKYLRVQAAKNLKTKPVIRYNGSKSKVNIFTIADGGILELTGLAFNNDAFDGKASATTAIGPAPVMRGHYSAFINDCEFYNFQESSFAPFKAQKNTYADTLLFTNCLFRDMSGDAISLAAEKDDAGRYSAEHVEVKNCAFYKVLGYAVDLYRGGSDESTTGPTIVVDHCVLEDVNNKERGSGMRLYGVQNVTIKNTIFSNTGRGGASIRFDEASWDKIAVTNCAVYNSGRISSFWGKVITGPIFNLKPEYQSITAYNFNLKPSSSLLNKGVGGTAVGLLNK